jgi:DNA polymerase-3 subunit alpha
MRRALMDLKPDRIEDLIAHERALSARSDGQYPELHCRPQASGARRWTYPPSRSSPAVLDETYGIIVYQEQVMQIAQLLSGYSLGEADMLRRAMGKKIKAEMDAPARPLP